MKKGVLIGDWQLVRLLSTGGMGQVWHALKHFDTGDKRAAAVKILRPAGVLDPRSRQALLNEAGIQVRLQHDNIPKVIDVGVHEGLPFLVMDYISGHDLGRCMSKFRDNGTGVPVEVAAHIARETAYALNYAHRFEADGVHEKIIHRDIAPKNIMISGDGGVFVLDFGVAESRSHRTSHNSVKGTLLYMAPEHALGFPTVKSDAWGLGAVLWEMLENRIFRSSIAPEQLRSAVNEGRVPALTRAGIPDVLRFVVEGLLRRDERDRLSIADVLEHLETPQFPPLRTTLRELMVRHFGPKVLNSGQTQHDFVISDELERAIAAGELAKSNLTVEPKRRWADEVFAQAAAPSQVERRSTRVEPRPLAIDDDEASAPGGDGSVEANDGVVPFEQRTTQRMSSPRTEAPPRVSTEVLDGVWSAPGGAVDHGPPHPTERMSPPDPPERRAHEGSGPAEARADERAEAPSVPAEREHSAIVLAAGASRGGRPAAPRARAWGRETSRVLIATIVVLVGCLSVGAALRLRQVTGDSVGLRDDGASTAPPHDDGIRRSTSPTVDGAPAFASSPVPVALETSAAPAASAQDAASEPPPGPPRSRPAPAQPARPTPARPVPAPAPSPTESDPSSPSGPATPKPTPTPVDKSTLNLALGFVDAVEVSVGGITRTLRSDGPDRATISIRPGLKTVRWRKPGEDWQPAGKVRIDEGVDYKVFVSSAGPSFDPITEEAP